MGKVSPVGDCEKRLWVRTHEELICYADVPGEEPSASQRDVQTKPNTPWDSQVVWSMRNLEVRKL